MISDGLPSGEQHTVLLNELSGRLAQSFEA